MKEVYASSGTRVNYISMGWTRLAKIAGNKAATGGLCSVATEGHFVLRVEKERGDAMSEDWGIVVLIPRRPRSVRIILPIS